MICQIVLDRVKLGPMAKKLPKDVLAFFRKQGSKGGKLGGRIRADNLTPEERQAIAKKGAEAMWAKRRGKK